MSAFHNDYRDVPALRQIYFLRAFWNCLSFFDQRANALRVRLCVSVAGKRVGATTGFNQDGRPDDASLDVDGRDLADADADLAEPPLKMSGQIISFGGKLRRETVFDKSTGKSTGAGDFGVIWDVTAKQ